MMKDFKPGDTGYYVYTDTRVLEITLKDKLNCNLANVNKQYFETYREADDVVETMGKAFDGPMFTKDEMLENVKQNLEMYPVFHDKMYTETEKQEFAKSEVAWALRDLYNSMHNELMNWGYTALHPQDIEEFAKGRGINLLED